MDKFEAEVDAEASYPTRVKDACKREFASVTDGTELPHPVLSYF